MRSFPGRSRGEQEEVRSIWAGLAFSLDDYCALTGTPIVFPPASVLGSVVARAETSVTVNGPDPSAGETVATAVSALTTENVPAEPLLSVTDAIGQVTTLQYANAANPLLITGVTDPFGRKAALAYDASGRLASLTDAAGMHSTFAYDGANNITTMTTPYGAATFTTWLASSVRNMLGT